jgi:hypothetical protein
VSEREEKGKSGVKGGGGQTGIVLSFLPVSVPRCCVALQLGTSTTLHAPTPPCKVVFAKPHRDSCSWGAVLRACSWGASLDGHVRGVASRRSLQSCSPSTVANPTSCRAAQTMCTTPSTGTEAHERRATRQRTQCMLGFPPVRGLMSQGTRPATPFIGDLGGGSVWGGPCSLIWKSVKTPPPPL